MVGVLLEERTPASAIRDLRDRIAVRAEQDATTLAAVIAHALHASDEEALWTAVARRAGSAS